jgi:NAD(P)-dependent dehydrogenase (short-subunit alcohol dehydrogenase family)
MRDNTRLLWLPFDEDSRVTSRERSKPEKVITGGKPGALHELTRSALQFHGAFTERRSDTGVTFRSAIHETTLSCDSLAMTTIYRKDTAMTFPVLEGKVAIITGAAMGMGEATARLFAEAGAKVAIADINGEKGQAVADDIVAAGHEAIFVKVDISAAAEVEAMVATVVQTWGRLDAAVNNAAMLPLNSPLAELDEIQWDRLLAVDLKGTALCLKYEIRQMQAQGGGGSIVNISSGAGFRPQWGLAAYVAAKHGVNGLTKVAAMENGPAGIRVNTVAPGAVDTQMLHDALAEANLGTEAEFAPKITVLGRFGQAREIAQATLWLASDQSSYVTGTVINVDGGYVGAM